MNSLEIDVILKANKSTKKIFLGVFACDTLPKIVPRRSPVLLICNTQPIRKSGEHWIAIFISKNKYGEYFDSFGLPPQNIYILRFLRRNCIKYKYNSKMIQSLFSNYCGHFCIMYVYYKSMFKSFESFIKHFNEKNLKANDNIVLNFFNVNICKNKACMNYFKKMYIKFF